MHYRQLGNSDIKVSVLGLGTMTWGHQNSESDAHQQIDLALAEGVNLIDTAEMYPTPTRSETWSTTERYIGNWLAANNARRAEIVLASKIAGPAREPGGQLHIRDGLTRHDRANIVHALDASLKRLNTDYLDLYQLHWPDRPTNIFGQREYPYTEDTQSVAIEETLSVLANQVKAGKVRHIGVSNETAWGVAEFLKQSERLGLPKIVSIQNPYSLLNRLYEGGLSEFTHREGVSLLAYSPLAFGALTGKYLNGARPEGSRLAAVYRTFNRYDSPLAQEAIADYVQLAKEFDLTPAQLALASVINKPFVASALTGQTSLAQLRDNLSAINVTLSPEILARIETIHQRIPNPAP